MLFKRRTEAPSKPRLAPHIREQRATLSFLSYAIAAATIVLANSPVLGHAETRYLVDHIEQRDKMPLRIRDIANRPCVTLRSTIRLRMISSASIDQNILAENACARHIVVKACYLDRLRCVQFDLHSHERKEVVLGTILATPFTTPFKFNFVEREGK
jgi:hypothetical protein